MRLEGYEVCIANERFNLKPKNHKTSKTFRPDNLKTLKPLTPKNIPTR